MRTCKRNSSQFRWSTFNCCSVAAFKSATFAFSRVGSFSTTAFATAMTACTDGNWSSARTYIDQPGVGAVEELKFLVGHAVAWERQRTSGDAAALGLDRNHTSTPCNVDFMSAILWLFFKAGTHALHHTPGPGATPHQQQWQISSLLH